MNYKNIKTGKVISGTCYNRLSYMERKQYVLTSESPTHKFSDDDDSMDFLTPLIVGEIIGSALSDIGSSDNSASFDSGSSSDNNSSTDFGGGDFGGAGAGESW